MTDFSGGHLSSDDGHYHLNAETPEIGLSRATP
jgi:hypothetical protein